MGAHGVTEEQHGQARMRVGDMKVDRGDIRQHEPCAFAATVEGAERRAGCFGEAVASMVMRIDMKSRLRQFPREGVISLRVLGKTVKIMDYADSAIAGR